MRAIRISTFMFVVLMSSAAFLQAQTAKPASPAPREMSAPASTAVSLPLQGFSLVLLSAETQGAIPTEGLSSQARKALADIREFLPYKGYRVLDTQWMASTGIGKITGQIKGLENQNPYTFMLTALPRDNAAATPDAELDHARFTLLSGPASAVLDTSFNIHSGETVVVGTSHLQDDQALVVLLTAVPVDAKGRR